VSPDKKTLWVVGRGANGVFVYSLPDLKVIKFIPTPRVKGAPANADGGDPGWITFTIDGKMAYIANAAANSVSAIDAKRMEVVAEIPVGEQPDHVFTLVLPDEKPPAAVRRETERPLRGHSPRPAQSVATRADAGVGRPARVLRKETGREGQP
jgi:YVTN family beta-propeller protein